MSYSKKKVILPDLFGNTEKPSAKITLSDFKKSSDEIKPKLSDSIILEKKSKPIKIEEVVDSSLKELKKFSIEYAMTYKTEIKSLPPITKEEQEAFIKGHLTLKQLKERKNEKRIQKKS